MQPTGSRWLQAAVLFLPMLLLLMLGLALPAQALETSKPFRDYVADSWGVEQGLPQITVLAITQDANGYLWFGTQSGLARFDGLHFRRIVQSDALGLDSNIQALLADAHGRLWIGTAKGLLVLENGQLRALSHLAPTATARFPVTALANLDGQILVGGPDGLYTPEGNHLRRVRALPGPMTSLLVDGQRLWVGTPHQVLRIDGDHVQAFPLPGNLPGAFATTLVHFDGDLWAGTRSGLLRLHDGHWQVVPGKSGDAIRAVEALAADHDGNLWLATPQYLERLRAGQAPERIEGRPGSIAIRSIFEDQDGNLWLGSQTEGVTRLWDGYTRRLSRQDGLTTPLLWAIAGAPDNSVVVGTSNGVEVWRNGHFQRLLDGSHLPHPEAYSLLPEANQLWVGTRAGVALLRNGSPHAELPPALKPLQGTQINGILRDHAGRLWFATLDGVFMLDGANQLTRYGEAQGLADARVRIVFETRNGRLLLGSAQGLYEWQNGRILPIGRTSGLSDDVAVSAITELKDGRWVLGSSSGENLRIFDGKQWQTLGSTRGLPENVPFHLAEITGNLWVAGMQGIYHVPLAQLDQALLDSHLQLTPELVINSGFNRPGGQQDKCCNGSGNNRGLLREGQLWFPTRDGALLVSAAPRPSAPQWKLRIEDVRSGGKLLQPVHGRLQLPLDARTLKIEFSTPSLQPAHLPQLRYRLLGYDSSWIALEDPSQRTASYANLPPGQYTFEVADFDRDNPLASKVQVELELPPHLHETLAFRILLVLLLILVVWLGYLGLRYQYARQRAVLEQQVQERTRDLQAANARLKEISFTDPLTGLHNRRYLSQQIPIDLSFYARDPAFNNGDEAVVFVLLDIDHFKLINDTYGHAAGDCVLEQLGLLLAELKRNGDYAARWGGEEFLLVLRPLPRGSLAQIGQRLCSRISAQRFDLGNGHFHQLTVSIGLVECPLFATHPHLLTWEQLVTLADRAMYHVKASGRNGWMAYRPLPGTVLPEDLANAVGDPGWLAENGLLELFGESGPDPHQGEIKTGHRAS